MNDMEKAIILNVKYEKTKPIETQGNRESIKKYLKQGYRIKIERNGYWVLIKSPKVYVTIGNSLVTKTYNMKQEIKDYYEEGKISLKLANRFKRDVDNGKITIYMDSKGNYKIK